MQAEVLFVETYLNIFFRLCLYYIDKKCAMTSLEILPHCKCVRLGQVRFVLTNEWNCFHFFIVGPIGQELVRWLN